MNNLFDRLLNKDIIVKTVAVIAAVALWFMVLEIQNPFVEKTINVPVKTNVEELENKNIKLINNNIFPLYVDISIKGRQQRLVNVGENDFEVFMDFSNVTAYTSDLSISNADYIGSESIIMNSINPESIKLELEKIISKQLDVSVVFENTLPENLVIENYSVEPASITIEDLQNRVDKVDNAYILVNPRIADNNTISSKILFKDENGEFVNLRQINSQATIKCTITKEVPIETIVIGKPSDKKYYIDHTIEINSVKITGSIDDLQNIESLKTDNINISEISENTDFKTKIILPEGISLLNNIDEIEGTIVLGDLETKSIIADPHYVILNGKNNQYNYIITIDGISITGRGTSQDLNSLDPRTLYMYASVEGLTEGEYILNINIFAGEGVVIIEKSDISVKIVPNEEYNETPIEEPPNENNNEQGVENSMPD